MKLSIIIASYNRAESLGHFLDQISDQVVPSTVDWECLIVDNNSTDQTHEVISRFAGQNPRRFRYLLEARQGKSAALNRGIRESAGDLLVFTDDDCIPRSDWLASIAHEFGDHPSLAAIGGRVELYNQLDKPVSIRTCKERTPISSPLEVFSLLIGCNMAIHRKVFDVVKEFDPLLGPGHRTKAFEDLDFLYRVQKQGFEMAYVPEVIVYHNHGRATDSEIAHLNRNYVVGRGAFYCKHILKLDRQVLKMAYWETSSLFKASFREIFSGAKDRDPERALWALLVGAVYRLSEN